MKSPRWAEREKAFGEAADLLQSADTSASDADRLRVGIIHLLGAENNDKTPVANEGEGESQGEYYAGLIAFVGHMDDERAIPALLGATGTGGMATRAVARFGKKALDPTLAQVGGQDAHLAEGALFVIRDMLEFNLVRDPDSLRRIQSTLRSLLGSADWGVRLSAISVIEYLNDREEFVPILKELAQHDPFKLPGQPDANGHIGDLYAVRNHATRLLRKIANHEPPVVDRGLPPEEYLPVKQ